MSVRKGCIFIVLIACVTAMASADNHDTQIPADVSAFVDQAVDFTFEALTSVTRRRVSVTIEPFSTAGTVSPLGELLSVSIATRIANRDDPGVAIIDTSTGTAASEYAVVGRVFGTETSVLVVIQLVDAETREIVRGIESGFGLSSWAESLLAVPETVVVAGGSDALEPDTIETAYALSTEERVENRSLSEGDEDWFVYTAEDISGQGLFTVGTSSGIDTYIEVYGPDDPDELFAENDDYSDANAQVTVVLEAGDVIWIKVRGYGNDVTGAYTLFSRLEPFEGDPLEPNDSIDDAVSIDVNGDPITTMIMPGSDEDWFSFDLSRAGGSNNVISIETRGALDTYLELFNRDGIPLLENDDGGEGGNARIDVFLDERGRYFVKVRHYDGSDQGEYELSVQLLQATPDQWEPDNTRSDAQEIEVDGQNQIRNFTPGDERDWVQFSLQATRTVEIRTTGDIDTYMTLYDRLGNVIEEDDDSGGDYNAYIERTLQRGVYYIELSQIAGDSVFGGEYALSVATF